MAKKKTTEKQAPEEALLNDLKRVQADFENYRKRIERDREQHAKLATESLLKDLLPVLDHFTLAIEHANSDPQQLLAGITMIRDQLQRTLEDHGIERIPTDIPFDPRLHEAITTTEEGDTKPGTITRVHQHGYTLAGKILQPAKVSIRK